MEWSLSFRHFGSRTEADLRSAPVRNKCQYDDQMTPLLCREPVEVLEEARRMRDTGYRSVKLKVGARTIAEDATLVRALGEELGDGISPRLDTNRAWGYEEAAEFLRDAACFEYIEEPLADPERLPEFVGEFGVP